MTTATTGYRVASVVLNFNSDADLQVSVPQLCAQEGIHHAVIIVDNASSPECVQRTQDWLREQYPDAVIGTVAEVDAWVQANQELAQENGRVYLMLNHENRGYSAGNNIGIKIAEKFGIDAVLICNPDMRIKNPRYLEVLAQALFSESSNCISASRIIGLDGKEQSPLRETNFWEELFWPIEVIKIFGRSKSNIVPFVNNIPQLVEKVSGCCFMLKVSLLKKHKYLDEEVFLYCEESILSKKIEKSKERIIFIPSINAVHAHYASEKSESYLRIKEFVKSRLYFNRAYRRYSYAKMLNLRISYGLLILIHKARYGLIRLRNLMADNK